jgi:opacity protein-like surface antigen
MQLNLDFQLMEQLTAGVFYQYRQDDSSGSTADSFSFKNNQVGLNVAYRF